MTEIRGESSIASFGLGYAIAVIAIAVVDALEAFIPSFSEWADETFSAPWLHLGVLGIIIFLAVGLAGIGRGQGWRRTTLMVAGAMIVGGLVIFGSTMILALRGGM